jgi:hypothetical protein
LLQIQINVMMGIQISSQNHRQLLPSSFQRYDPLHQPLDQPTIIVSNSTNKRRALNVVQGIQTCVDHTVDKLTSDYFGMVLNTKRMCDWLYNIFHQSNDGCLISNHCLCCDTNFVTYMNDFLISRFNDFSDAFQECLPNVVQCDHIDCTNVPSSCEDPIITQMQGGWCITKPNKGNYFVTVGQECIFDQSIHVTLGTSLTLTGKDINVDDKHTHAYFNANHQTRHFVVDGELTLENIILKGGYVTADTNTNRNYDQLQCWKGSKLGTLGECMSGDWEQIDSNSPKYVLEMEHTRRSQYFNWSANSGGSILVGNIPLSHNVTCNGCWQPSKLNVKNCIFDGNMVDTSIQPFDPNDHHQKLGGGSLMIDNHAIVTITNTIFQNHGTTRSPKQLPNAVSTGTGFIGMWGKGGALHIRGNSQIIIKNTKVVFTNNILTAPPKSALGQADKRQYFGGSIFMMDSSIVIDNSELIIEKSSSTYMGGGMYMLGGSMTLQNHAKVHITKNNAYSMGGGMMIDTIESQKNVVISIDSQSSFELDENSCTFGSGMYIVGLSYIGPKLTNGYGRVLPSKIARNRKIDVNIHNGGILNIHHNSAKMYLASGLPMGVGLLVQFSVTFNIDGRSSFMHVHHNMPINDADPNVYDNLNQFQSMSRSQGGGILLSPGFIKIQNGGK